MFILLPKLLYRMYKNYNVYHSKCTLLYKLDIISSKLKNQHIYCHERISETLTPCFNISINKIEILSINSIEINNTTAITCNVQISSNSHESSIDSMMNKITDNKSKVSKSFQSVKFKHFIIFN